MVISNKISRHRLRSTLYMNYTTLNAKADNDWSSMSINVMPSLQCYVRMGVKSQWTCYKITPIQCKIRNWSSEWMKQNRTNNEHKRLLGTLLMNPKEQLIMILVVLQKCRRTVKSHALSHFVIILSSSISWNRYNIPVKTIRVIRAIKENDIV